MGGRVGRFITSREKNGGTAEKKGEQYSQVGESHRLAGEGGGGGIGFVVPSKS